MIFIWLPLLFVVFSFRVFAGDVIVTVDRFKHNNDAPVRFSICDSKECHTKRDTGYVDIDFAEFLSTNAEGEGVSFQSFHLIWIRK